MSGASTGVTASSNNGSWPSNDVAGEISIGSTGPGAAGSSGDKGFGGPICTGGRSGGNNGLREPSKPMLRNCSWSKYSAWLNGTLKVTAAGKNCGPIGANGNETAPGGGPGALMTTSGSVSVVAPTLGVGEGTGAAIGGGALGVGTPPGRDAGVWSTGWFGFPAKK